MKTIANRALTKVLLLVAWATAATAAVAEPSPWPEVAGLPGNGGTMVVGPAALYKGGHHAADGVGTLKEATFVGQPGYTADITKGSVNSYDVELNWRNDKALLKDEIVWVSFAARATKGSPETGQGSLTMYGQVASPPWTAFGSLEAAVGPKWQRYETAMKVDRAYAAQEAHFSLHLAQQVQTLDIADFQVRSFGVGADVNALPHLLSTYEGREADAPWRAEADKRIDQLRKADLKIEVVDAAGKPVAGASVKVAQKSHAFRFGTCINEDWINDTTPDGEKYREILTKYFNHAVIENGLKWQGWEQSWSADGMVDVAKLTASRARLYAAIDWMREHGMTVRGHNLVWPSKEYLPKDVIKLTEDKDLPALKRRIANRISDGARAMHGRVVEWDVVNEPVANHYLQDALGGPSVMTDWYKQAHAADPSARLVLNDYTMLSGGATRLQQIDAFYNNVKRLIDEGAPIGAIGEQGHFSNNCTGMKRMLGLLDRFGALGLPIVLTEFDVNSGDEQLKADYTRDFYTAAFSHPSVDGILMWGFWEKAHWMPRAAPWGVGWNQKPNGKAYVDLVYGKWWTNTEVPTDAAGIAMVRGFKGQFDVSVTRDGKTTTVPCELGSQGATVRVEIGGK